jgi:four helix bundle protein
MSECGGGVGGEYDLEERTARFGEEVIALCKRVRFDPVNSPIISQLVRSATSVASNYCEADDAESKKDFRHKIGICRKESKESKLHLRMLAAAENAVAVSARELWQEAKELNLIFGKIIRSCDGR